MKKTNTRNGNFTWKTNIKKKNKTKVVKLLLKFYVSYDLIGTAFGPILLQTNCASIPNTDIECARQEHYSFLLLFSISVFIFFFIFLFCFFTFLISFLFLFLFCFFFILFIRNAPPSIFFSSACCLLQSTDILFLLLHIVSCYVLCYYYYIRYHSFVWN